MELSDSPILMTVLYMTILIASLNMLSPKTIAYRFSSASICLKMERTATGSVAEIKEPNAQESLKVKGNDQPNYPVTQNIMLENRMAMNVPTKEYINTLPKFLKKGPFCMLYPDSKMIGGSSNSINSLLKCEERLSIVALMPISCRSPPASIPINVVSPASCKYLCPDLCKKAPAEIAIKRRKKRHKISVEIAI